MKYLNIYRVSLWQTKAAVMVADNLIQSRVDDPSTPALDQYADGRAAKMWEIFIGDKNSRTENYKKFLLDLLRSKGCRRILDVACGTGYQIKNTPLIILCAIVFMC